MSLPSVVLAAGLAVAFAAPANAALAPNSAPNPAPSRDAAYSAWASTSSLTDTAVGPRAASPNLAGPGAMAAAAGGERITDKHGGPLLWTANTLEWYFTSSKITSSTGSQADGYIFPNTASKGGIKRTLVAKAQHNWRGTMIVGEGTVTPWGSVNLFSTTRTDYYVLLLNGKFRISE